MPECYIIAGPNGSGKSTFACQFLPNGRCVRNLLHVYKRLLHTLHIFDNSTTEPELIFHQDRENAAVLNQAVYDQLVIAAGTQP